MKEYDYEAAPAAIALDHFHKAAVLIRVPKITGPLRKHLLELAADPAQIVNRTFARMKEQEESYARLSAAGAQDVLSYLDYCAKLLFNTLTRGALPSTAEFAVIADVARRRVHQGVSLTSILRAWRFGSLEVWRACIAVPKGTGKARDQLLFSVSSFILEFFDLLSQTMSQAYLDEQYEHARWRDSMRYELASIVFQFPDDVEGFRKAAEALGIDPTAARIALAFHLSASNDKPASLDGEMHRLVIATSRKLKIPTDDLVRVLHRGRAILWLPTVRGESAVAANSRVTACARQLLKTHPNVHAIGIGLMNQGPGGWAMTVDEANKALDYGLRTQSARAVHMYSDIAINESVRRADNVLRYLNSLLERFADEPELLSTLRTYFEHRQHRRLAAEALRIHPNTLNHRLGRIESILGADLEDDGWIAKLHVMLKLQQ